MSGNASSFFVGSNLSLRTPSIINDTIAVANTEQAIVLPNETKFFRLKNEGSKILKLSYTATESGTEYYSIYPKCDHPVSGIAATSVTLYVQSPENGLRIEIECWS